MSSLSTIHMRDLQLLAADPGLSQLTEYILWHPLWQINGAVVLMDLDLANILIKQSSHIGNSSHNIVCLYLMLLSNLQAEELSTSHYLLLLPLFTPLTTLPGLSRVGRPSLMPGATLPG